jgi:hypothetical protein
MLFPDERIAGSGEERVKVVGPKRTNLDQRAVRVG